MNRERFFWICAVSLALGCGLIGGYRLGYNNINKTLLAYTDNTRELFLLLLDYKNDMGALVADTAVNESCTYEDRQARWLLQGFIQKALDKTHGITVKLREAASDFYIFELSEGDI